MILEGGYGNEAFRNRLEKGAPGWNPGLSGRSAGRGVGGRGWRSSDPALFPPCREMVSEGGGKAGGFTITQWSSNLPVTTAGARERAGFMEQPV